MATIDPQSQTILILRVSCFAFVYVFILVVGVGKTNHVKNRRRVSSIS